MQATAESEFRGCGNYNSDSMGTLVFIFSSQTAYSQCSQNLPSE